MKQTLIGKFVRAVNAKNPSLQGIEGKVVDETKNTITIRKKDKQEKRMIKKQVTLAVDGKVVEGAELTKRIEERMKK